MKKSLTKLITSCAAVMAVTAAMAVSASAAEYANGSVDLTEITALPSQGQNTVLVIEGTKDDLDAAIQDTTKIKYINQASAADAAGWLNALPVGTDLDVDNKTYTVFMGGEGVNEILSEEFGKSSVTTVKKLMGDVNGNSRVDTGDAVVILKYGVSQGTDATAAEKIVADKNSFTIADVNGNSRVDTGDAVIVLKYAVSQGTDATAAAKIVEVDLPADKE